MYMLCTAQALEIGGEHLCSVQAWVSWCDLHIQLRLGRVGVTLCVQPRLGRVGVGPHVQPRTGRVGVPPHVQFWLG